MDTERAGLHVLMVLESCFPSPNGGGAEAQVRTLARAMRAKGHRVTVLTPLTRSGPQHTIARVDGVPVCRLRYPRVPLLGGAVLWLRLAGFLWTRRHRYDAWHVHIAHHLGAVCALLGGWLDKPVIVKVSGWWELQQGVLAAHAPLSSRIAYRCLLRASVWQAISRRIAAALIETGVPAARIAAIPNAVDTARFRGVAHSPSGAPRFVFIGRLVPEKGLDTLLHAFAGAQRGGPRASLRLIGSGPLMPSLVALARELGIAEQVEFCGHRDDIEAVLADADIGVLASRIEGLSNTLLETMAAGLPMVASRVSGSEDIVRPGDNGWLFEPGDRNGLAACLVEAASLPSEHRLAMGARARETVEQHAGLDRVVGSLLGLYRRAPIAAVAAVAMTHRSL